MNFSFFLLEMISLYYLFDASDTNLSHYQKLEIDCFKQIWQNFSSISSALFITIFLLLFRQVTLVLGLAHLFLVETLFSVITIYSFIQFQKMKQAWMTFSVTFQFFNLEHPNVIFLWKIHGFTENLWFSIELSQIPGIWPHIRIPRSRKPFGQSLWKIHGSTENLWFSIEPY
jgi:hypothetical protein